MTESKLVNNTEAKENIKDEKNIEKEQIIFQPDKVYTDEELLEMRKRNLLPEVPCGLHKFEEHSNIIKVEAEVIEYDKNNKLLIPND